jgi:hypothetical protein
MAALGSKNSFRFSTVILSIAALVLFAGCEKLTVADTSFYNKVSIQATVKNNTSGALSVSLLPALGSRKKSAYQWAIGGGEIGLAPDSFPTETAELTANSEQVLRTSIWQSAETDDNGHYQQVGDKILSFLLKIDGDEYAGWDALYGTGDRTLADQGYGYAVLGDYGDYGGYTVIKWNSPLKAGNEYTGPSGAFYYITVRYTISITDSGVEFILDEVAYYLREYPTDFLEHDDPDGG